jgi:hypothetical protein
MADEFNVNLPDDIRQIFIHLFYECRRLNMEWNYYLELFGNKTNSVLLARTANVFFETVEEVFRYDMAMAIIQSVWKNYRNPFDTEKSFDLTLEAK